MPKGVFDVLECCEVFVLSLRAMYTLVMVFNCANTCGNISALIGDKTRNSTRVLMRVETSPRH